VSRCRPLRAFLTLAASAAATLALLLAPPAPAQAVTLMPGATTAHPFSDPLWWPLRTETFMDCYRGNYGCTNPLYHTSWILDVVSSDYTKAYPHEPVYAMGAGIVHYGVHADTGCGHAQGRGNWLWIDHGNGTLSWYGHLAWPFKVPNGAYVTPKTQIALVGNSGYSGCNKYPTMHYIDIAVKHGATNGQNNGNYVEFRHLYACVNGHRQTWPDQLNDSWRRWNDVPNSPYGNRHVLPGSDRTSDCIPSQAATPDRATGVGLRRSGSAQLTATWRLPSTGAARTSIVVLIREYHPSIRRWLDLRSHVVPSARTGTTFTGLHLKHYFRVRVSFHNSVGYSAPTGSAAVVAT